MVIERKAIQQIEANFRRQFENQIITVDSHTAGEPTRLVVGGLPNLPGETINEKRSVFQDVVEFYGLDAAGNPQNVVIYGESHVD